MKKRISAMKLRVSMTCLRFGLYAFIGFARQVVSKMTGNTNFTTPTPPLADITTGLDDLQTKADAAVGGGKIAYAVRDTAWENSVMQIRNLASYVQLMCQNNLDILQSSGFSATKTPVPYGTLPAPQNLRTSYYRCKSGELWLQLKRVAGVRAGYCYQQAESPEGPFVEVSNSNKSRVLITGLTPAKTYYFRACANGAEKPSAWSTVVSAIAL
jgi:hypothetical protein